MSYPHKTFWWDMHQKPTNELFTGDCDTFPLSLMFVVLCSKGDRMIGHALNAIVADGNPMSILSKITDHGFSAIKRFFAVRNPFPAITDV